MTTGDGAAVHVAWANIADQLENDTIGEIFILFRPDGERRWSLADDPATLDAAIAASGHANDVIEYDNANARSVSPSPYGPVVELEHPEDEEALSWIATFGEHLSTAGFTGTVEPAPQTWLSQWLDDCHSQPKVTALQAFRLSSSDLVGHEDQQATASWTVDATTTAAICNKAVQWCSAVPNGDVYLYQGSSTVLLDEPESPRSLSAALQHGYDVAITHARRTPMTVRRAYLSWWGQAGYQLHAAEVAWRARLDAALEILVHQPSQLDLSIVRLSYAWVGNWLDLGGKNPALPRISEGDWRLNRPLWSRLTPDAHGAQVLTEAHLARAHDLSNWDIDEIAPGRYLVQAEDLEPWFAGDYPDPDVLAAARNDFGDMILTPEAIREYGRP